MVYMAEYVKIILPFFLFYLFHNKKIQKKVYENKNKIIFFVGIKIALYNGVKNKKV